MVSGQTEICVPKHEMRIGIVGSGGRPILAAEWLMQFGALADPIRV